MGKGRQIIYHVKAEPYGDAINGFTGEERIPVKGDVVQRDGKQWKVTHVNTEYSGDGKTVPIVRVYLTDDLSLPIYP